MKNNLQNRNGTYYFRRVVPVDIRHLLPTPSGKPRTEWVWSLGKDYKAAHRRVRDSMNQTDLIIEQARTESARIPAQPQSARGGAAGVLNDAEAEGLELASQESAAFFETHYAEQEARADTDPDFALRLERRALEAQEVQQLRTRREDAELATEMRAARRLGLMELYDKYAAVPGRHAKTVAQWRPYVAHLIRFVGHDNALALTERNLMEWRNHLRDGHTVKGKRLSAKTINGSYLGAISAIFVWGKNDGLLTHNPMREVGKVQVPRAARTRAKDFTPDEARAILSATLLPCVGREGVDFRNAKRWIPWLLAYSGARVNELTQLRKQDIIQIDGIHVMRLTPEAGSIKTKIARVVPLHSDVVQQGFLEFVSERPEGPLFFNPEKRRSDAAINRQANRLGSKLATWVRSLGLRDAELKPNHAWRHLFNTLALRHKLHPRATLAILGHSARNVNDSYGTVPVDIMAESIEMLPPFLADHFGSRRAAACTDGEAET